VTGSKNWALLVMEAMKSQDGSFTPALLLATGLLVIGALVIARLHDPVVHLAPVAPPADA